MRKIEDQNACHLVVNPASGRGRGGRLQTRLGEALGVDASCIRSSKAPGDVETLVREAAESGCDTIVVAGGDGSVYEAVNGIMASGRAPALAIVPTGTGNDFIKAAGIPLGWRDACRLATSGRVREVDLGRCNGRFFANGVGIGLDAEIGRTAQGMWLFRGPVVYLAAAFRTLVGGISAPEVDVRHDGGEVVQRVTLIAVSNGTCYGGLFHIAPEASIADGILDLVIADHVNRRRALRLIPRVIRGEHMDDPVVSYHQTRQVHIRASGPLPVQIDGELVEGGLSELEIEVVPACLRLVS